MEYVKVYKDVLKKSNSFNNHKSIININKINAEITKETLGLVNRFVVNKNKNKKWVVQTE